MNILGAFQKALETFQTELKARPTTTLNVVNQPARNITDDWRRAYLGPGIPQQPLFGGWRGKLEEHERGWAAPRSYSYTPNVNVTVTPRIAYGLASFSTLKYYAENIPEVGMLRRMIAEELRAFIPTIKSPEGEIVQKARTVRRLGADGKLRKVLTGDNELQIDDLAWMTTSPDRRNNWYTWISRLIYNMDVYDGAAVYRMRDDRGRIAGLRVIDASTLFCIVDEHGEAPLPPMPAFCQVIYGVPRMWLTTDQISYKPRHLRPDAPYGLTAIEDAWSAVLFLESWWTWQRSWYTQGANPGRAYTAPQDWTPDQIFAYLDAMNARLAGNAEDRQKAWMFPHGVAKIADRDAAGADVNNIAYETANRVLSLAWGVPASEQGQAPGEGLGGTGYQKAGTDTFYRLALAPRISHIESFFDEVLGLLGYPGYKMELEFPSEGVDAGEEEERWVRRWQTGLVRRNEARGQLGMDPLPDDDAAGREFYATPSGAGADPLAALLAGSAAGDDGGGSNDVAGNGQPAQPRKVRVIKRRLRKHCGVCPEDDDYYGQPVRALGDGVVVVKPDELPPRVGRWIPGEQFARRAEAAYMIDRALGYRIVPVSYSAAIDDEWGLVELLDPAQGAKRLMRPGAVLEPWNSRLRALQWIFGSIEGELLEHPDEVGRCILGGAAVAIEAVNPTMPTEIPAVESNSLFGALYEGGLWEDVEDLIGEAACEWARRRLERLLEFVTSIEAQLQHASTEAGWHKTSGGQYISSRPDLTRVSE